MIAAPPDSGHFAAWMTLVGAGIALVASLASVGLSVVLSARAEARRDAARRLHADQIEERGRQHEAAVRFHDDRLNAYVEFAGAALHLAAQAKVWQENGAQGSSFMNSKKDLAPYINANARTRMLCKDDVAQQVLTVQQLVRELATELHGPEEVGALAETLIKAIGQFEAAAKRELGIT